MSMSEFGEFGPVPVGRLEAELPGVLAAIEQGRTVLVSYQGRVIAALGPVPSLETILDIQRWEETLQRFEHEHPNATAAEFAAEVERVRQEMSSDD